MKIVQSAVRAGFLPVLTNGRNTVMVSRLFYQKVADTADAYCYKTGDKVGYQYGNDLDRRCSRVF